MYAKDSYLERTVAEMARIRQSEDEDELTFARRLTKEARMCSLVSATQELFTYFLQGVSGILKRPSFDGPEPSSRF